MHTTRDYINKSAPELWLHHNSDFSGVVYVNWKIKGTDQEWTFEWEVNGADLLSGNIVGTQWFKEHDQMSPVPSWVVGRAVQIAVRTHLTRKMVSFVENL